MSADDLLKRLQSKIPPDVSPKFTTTEEWKAFQEEQGRMSSQQIIATNRSSRLNTLMGRSGISELHKICTFENYDASTDEQRSALRKAKSYAADFGSGFGGFIFSGGCGTGKNHMAAAIGNKLISTGNSVLIATVPDLMMKFRETYRPNSKMSEADLMNDLCRVGLLVLDDIGVQRDTTSEAVILFQIIDRRLSSKKPVGMLTNLDQKEMVALLGERIMDRMRMDGGMWINFNWSSYRKQVKS